jgi:hypothetical protein
VISLATGGLVQASDVSALTAIADQAAATASDITTQTIEEVIKHHEEAQDEVDQFRSILAGCAQGINERELGSARRLIVFVDELDRRRPDYAVHVLECIKHFFAVDNVIFVIAIDRGALTESICSVYGTGIDADGYLRKFFDYHVGLPPPLYEKFAELLAQSLRLKEALPSRLDDWLRLFPVWARAFNLSLHVQEQTLSQANFIVRSYGTNKIWMIYDLILFLLCIPAKDAALFNRISNDNLELEVLLPEAEKLIDARLGDDDLDRMLGPEPDQDVVSFGTMWFKGLRRHIGGQPYEWSLLVG